MEIFIDFDGTVSPKHFPEKLTEPPFEGCVEAISRLYREGHKITIFSCRFNRELFNNPDAAQRKIEQEMVEYLATYYIPYHTIYRGKPLYHLLIDDRGYKASSSKEWKKVVDFVHDDAISHTLEDQPEEKDKLYERFTQDKS